MDAQKLNFMMSIQNEIDKLSLKIGADHQSVKDLKNQFEKLSQTELKKQDNSSISNIDLLPIKNDTELIIDQFKRVNQKFDVIDKEIEDRAIFFYKDLKLTSFVSLEFKNMLIKNFELFELSLKKEDHKLASKYAIVQLEGILNIFEQDLIIWETNNPTRQYSQFNYITTQKNGIKTMPFKAKCNSIQVFLNLKFFGHKKLDLVYDLRGYESHQYSQDKILESEAKLLTLKNSPNEYYGEIFKFIKQCVPHVK